MKTIFKFLLGQKQCAELFEEDEEECGGFGNYEAVETDPAALYDAERIETGLESGLYQPLVEGTGEVTDFVELTEEGSRVQAKHQGKLFQVLTIGSVTLDPNKRGEKIVSKLQKIKDNGDAHLIPKELFTPLG